MHETSTAPAASSLLFANEAYLFHISLDNDNGEYERIIANQSHNKKKKMNTVNAPYYSINQLRTPRTESFETVHERKKLFANSCLAYTSGVGLPQRRSFARRKCATAGLGS